MYIIKKFNESIKQDLDINSYITNITFSEDWYGLYVGEELISEGHSLEINNILPKMIEMGLNLTDYKYGILDFLRNDIDYELTEEDCDDFGYSLPSNMNVFLKKLNEIGIEYKIREINR